MTPDQLRRIAQAATEGPWEYRGDYFGVRQVPTDQHLVGPNKYEMEGIVPGEYIRAEDAEFIATFNPARVLELLDQIEQLQAVVRDQHDDCTYQTRLAAVEQLHHISYAADTQVCEECWTVWPCDTIKAARGE